jgi:L-malate glycosyltransferase
LTDKLPHILILASWYPNVESPYNGDFIQQIARETSLHYRVTVLQIVKTQRHNTGTGLVRKKINSGFEEWVYYSYRRGIFGFLATGAKLFHQIQKERGKVSFCHVQVIWKMGLLALWLKIKHKLPYVITEHWTGYLPEHFQFKKKTLRMFTRQIPLSNCD